MAEGALDRKAGIIALGQEKGRNVAQSFDPRRHRLRPQARRIDDQARPERKFFAIALYRKCPAVTNPPDRSDASAAHQGHVSQQGKHVLVTVDDPRGRREQARLGRDFGLARGDLPPAQGLQIVNAAVRRHLGDGCQLRILSGLGDDQFPQPFVRHAMGGAKLVQ